MKRPIRFVIALAAFAVSSIASAQLACTARMGDVNFGSVNRVGSGYGSVVGLVEVECRNAITPQVRACIDLGAPPDNNWTPRHLAGPNGVTLAYDICQDAACTRVWGSVLAGSALPVALDLDTQDGSATASVPYYARIAAQNDAPAGSYAATYGGVDAVLRAVGHTGAAPACGADVPVASYFAFSVQAMVTTDCRVTASPLDFGQTGVSLGTTPLEATSTISVTCTSGVPYSIVLDAGQGSGATPALRRMTRNGGSESITYRLYSDAARTQLWGDGSNGTTAVAGSGVGIMTAQNHTVYGAIPAQPAAAPGTYVDTVTVTVTY